MSRLRICLVGCFPPSRGDLNEYGFHIASALREKPDVDLVVLADRISSPGSVSGELSDFKVERCWRFNSFLTPLHLLRAIRRANPDVVWFNMGFSTFARNPVAALLSMAGPVMARRMGFYTHVTLHTMFNRINLQDAGVRLRRLYRLAGGFATRFVLASHDVTVLLPSFRSELLTRFSADVARVHYRPHGTFNRTSPIAPRRSAENIILAFGYWGTYKRLELLLESMEGIAAAVPNAQLIIAGMNHPSAPGYLESLERRYNDTGYISFVGYVPEADLPKLFQQAKVLVLPYSSAAGTSGVVHQACEHGLPMVAAAIPELVELASEYGIKIEFYPPGDSKMLKGHLVRILKSETLSHENDQDNLSVGQTMQMSQVVGGYLNLFKARRSFRKLQTGTSEPAPVRVPLQDEVGRWMLMSGIQHESGGVARYFLSDVRRNMPPSTEVTAYCAAGFLLLHERTGETRYFEAGLKAAHYLTDLAWDPESCSIPFECEGNGPKYGYFFDTGIIVRGLLSMWRKWGHKRILSIALECADFMANCFFAGGEYSPVITLPDKRCLDCESWGWSQNPGCYQLKASLAWRELGEITREDRYSRLYDSMLNRCLQTYTSFLPGSEDDVKVMDRLHAYAYFLEGLLPEIDRPGCRQALREGIVWLDGYAKKVQPKFLRSDVLAQLLRIRLFADQARVLPVHVHAIEEEAAEIRRFQSHDTDSALNGGFWFGKKLGKIEPFMNPVSTLFCFQALDMWERYQEGERDWNWRDLI